MHINKTFNFLFFLLQICCHFNQKHSELLWSQNDKLSFLENIYSPQWYKYCLQVFIICLFHYFCWAALVYKFHFNCYEARIGSWVRRTSVILMVKCFIYHFTFLIIFALSQKNIFHKIHSWLQVLCKLKVER